MIVSTALAVGARTFTCAKFSCTKRRWISSEGGGIGSPNPLWSFLWEVCLPFPRERLPFLVRCRFFLTIAPSMIDQICRSLTVLEEESLGAILQIITVVFCAFFLSVDALGYRLGLWRFAYFVKRNGLSSWPWNSTI